MYNPELHFHFIGIGGSGMSGIAEILIHQGFRVSGSDIAFNTVTQRLESLGAVISKGHSAKNVPPQASLVVYSSAVGKDNPEILIAVERGIPVVPRAEVLAELMRLKYGIAVAGSHGKTTTTSMIGAILMEAGFDPTVVIGGIVTTVGTGARFGKGEYLVAESDESDRSFLLLKPSIAVITNIDKEHLTAYRSFDELEESFHQFAESVPFYGLCVLCADDKKVLNFVKKSKRRCITYGKSEHATLKLEDCSFHKGVSEYTVSLKYENTFKKEKFRLNMPGEHLVINSLAAIAVALELKIPCETIRNAFLKFKGVKRRIEVIKESRGITVINDYAHHPTEVLATLKAVKEGWKGSMKRLHVVFQPHRYTRIRDCFEGFIHAFQEADNVYITPIYAASETPLESVTAEKLCEALHHSDKCTVPSLDEVLPVLQKKVEKDDVVLFLGAGTINTVAEKYSLSL
jgi:UDP-N-acetylmuramate--alanine ligase